MLSSGVRGMGGMVVRANILLCYYIVFLCMHVCSAAQSVQAHILHVMCAVASHEWKWKNIDITCTHARTHVLMRCRTTHIYMQNRDINVSRYISTTACVRRWLTDLQTRWCCTIVGNGGGRVVAYLTFRWTSARASSF